MFKLPDQQLLAEKKNHCEGCSLCRHWDKLTFASKYQTSISPVESFSTLPKINLLKLSLVCGRYVSYSADYCECEGMKKKKPGNFYLHFIKGLECFGATTSCQVSLNCLSIFKERAFQCCESARRGTFPHDSLSSVHHEANY